MPSADVSIAKLYLLSFPLNHAISTLQMLFVDPKSARIHKPLPGFDHLVFKLRPITFEGTLPLLPLAVAAYRKIIAARSSMNFVD